LHRRVAFPPPDTLRYHGGDQRTDCFRWFFRAVRLMLIRLIASKRFGDILKVVIQVCSYVFSLSMAVLGLVVLMSGGLSLGVGAIAAAIIFWPHLNFPTFWRFFFGIIVVVFLL